MKALDLIESPRLYVNADIAENLADKLHSPFLQTYAQRVLKDADWLVRIDPIREGEGNSYLEGGRWVRTHIENLTCAWVLTRKKKYREAAMKHLAGLLEWNQISCEARLARPDDPRFYCLLYGEQSAAIGVMYDVFRPDMTRAEKKVFFDVLKMHHVTEAIRCLTRPPWWVGQGWTNWNGVCSGGMGIMALALYDDMPKVRQLIPFVEKSLRPYFRSYVRNGGGNAEGTGYWNYGMNHAMRYILSWENATRHKHPALRIKELGKTLYFPTDFQGLTFGDNDGWHPTAFYFMLANRMNEHHAALRGATFLPDRVDVKGPRRRRYADNGDLLFGADYIPAVEEIKKLKELHQKKRMPVTRLYHGLDWAMLSDDEVSPKLRMAVRGGSCKAGGHSFADLLSFRCRVNGEMMISDQADTGYLTTTFGTRGSDIYSRGPRSKSTLIVEGLGCDVNARCDKTEIVQTRGIKGVRILATHIYLPRMREVKFIGRLFLFVENKYWLVIDHLLSRDFSARLGMESRFHTYAKCKVGRQYAFLKQGKERMHMTFAALKPGFMQTSRGMPPMASGKQTTIMRWMSGKRAEDNLHVVALNPGTQKLYVKVGKKKDDTYFIEVTRPDGKKRRIHIDTELNLL